MHFSLQVCASALPCKTVQLHARGAPHPVRATPCKGVFNLFQSVQIRARSWLALQCLQKLSPALHQSIISMFAVVAWLLCRDFVRLRFRAIPCTGGSPSSPCISVQLGTKLSHVRASPSIATKLPFRENPCNADIAWPSHCQSVQKVVRASNTCSASRFLIYIYIYVSILDQQEASQSDEPCN